MNSALLKHRISIEKLSLSKSVQGAPIETWQVIASRRAQIKQGIGRKEIENNVEIESNVYVTTFKFRTVPLLNYDCRIVFDSNVYTIQSIEKLFRREGHVVITERGENHG